MKLKAYGNNVIVKPIMTDIEEKAAKAGLTAKAANTKTRGEVVSLPTILVDECGVPLDNGLDLGIAVGDKIAFTPYGNEPQEADGVEYLTVPLKNITAVIVE